MRKIGTAFKVNGFYYVVILGDSLDSAPEVKSFELIFGTKSFDAGLQISSLLNWEGLTDSVDKLEFCLKIDDIHWGSSNIFIRLLNLRSYKFQIVMLIENALIINEIYLKVFSLNKTQKTQIIFIRFDSRS